MADATPGIISDSEASNNHVPSQDEISEELVLFRMSGNHHIGDITRFIIEYLPDERLPPRKSLFLRVTNTELGALRAAYLNGPYTLYVDCRPGAYREDRRVDDDTEKPTYDNNVRAGQSFNCDLHVKGIKKHIWTVDVCSDIMFSSKAQISFQIVIATSKKLAKSSDSPTADPLAEEFRVHMLDTISLWSQPLPKPDVPLHLVVLTHGLVSNVTADMFYLKENIDVMAQRTGQNIICKGYTGNAGKTEKGIKRQGRKVAEWIMNELIPTYHPAKVSFVAHSLGGLVQTYALGYIEKKIPNFFEQLNIELVNFVAIASPFLGITSENPGYVRMALEFGIVGKSGRDLGMSRSITGRKPILKCLPFGPSHDVIARFKHRTLYANAVNDGIVPLRTASLLYLDWRAIAKASAAKSGNNAHDFHVNRENPKQEDQVLREDDPNGKFNGNRESRREFKTKEADEEEASYKMATWNPFVNPFKVGTAKAIVRSQTRDENGETKPQEIIHKRKIRLPKKTSLLESGFSAFMPPHPDDDFISDPSKRSNVIFHDRIYYEKDLPPRRFRNRLIERDEMVEQARTEEKLARAWHKGTSWRKILVQLLPDAHNNILVRRRFSNAYGWPVIDHVVKHHFGADTESSDGVENEGLVAEVSDDEDIDPTLPRGPEHPIVLMAEDDALRQYADTSHDFTDDEEESSGSDETLSLYNSSLGSPASLTTNDDLDQAMLA